MFSLGAAVPTCDMHYLRLEQREHIQKPRIVHVELEYQAPCVRWPLQGSGRRTPVQDSHEVPIFIHLGEGFPASIALANVPNEPFSLTGQVRFRSVRRLETESLEID